MNAPLIKPKLGEAIPKRKPRPQGDTQKATRIEQLLTLEAKVRDALTLSELQYLICNETCKLVPGRQVIVHRGNPAKKNWRIEKVSSVSELDRNAPLLVWLDEEIRSATLESTEAIVPIRLKQPTTQSRYPFTHGLFVAFKDKQNNSLGGMTILSTKALADHDRLLLERLGKTYEHAWAALKPSAGIMRNLFSRRAAFLVVCILILIGCIPVRLTVLAPVEVVAQDANVVAAPINGVIDEIIVSPNSRVNRGDLLFKYNPIDLENRYEIALRNMEVAKARFQRATQSAYSRGDGLRELTVTKAEYEVALAEQEFAKAQKARMEVYAPSSGVVLFSGEEDWVGKPVVIGERIMRLADPGKTEFKISVAASDSVILDDNFDVRVFLNADPLNPVSADVTRKSYTAERDSNEHYSYPVLADISENTTSNQMRIGLRGTAQLSGRKVALAFNLFRKPLSAIRQYLGI